MKATLERNGLQALEAYDGLHALEVLGQLRYAIDLVISDITMPRMDGLEMAFTIRTRFPNLPILLITGSPDGAKIKELHGEFPLVKKPFTPKTLLEAVQRILGSES